MRLNSLGFRLLFVGALCAQAANFLSPSASGQLFHGVSIGKWCQISHCLGDTINCFVELAHIDDFGDTLEIVEAYDRIDPGGHNTRAPAVGNLSIIEVSGNTNCEVGGSLPCWICAPNNSRCGSTAPSPALPGQVILGENAYIMQPGDPNRLSVRAQVVILDRCDGCCLVPNPPSDCEGAPDGLPPCSYCSTIPNPWTYGFTASTQRLYCADDDPCATATICQNGECLPGDQVDCSSQDDQCRTGVCDPDTGDCVSNSTPHEGLTCDDSNPCTSFERCVDGNCVGFDDCRCAEKENCGDGCCVPPGESATTCPADCSDLQRIVGFLNCFSGDAPPEPNCQTFDVDQDASVTLIDYILYLRRHFGGISHDD